jgi:hypothetical protein
VDPKLYSRRFKDFIYKAFQEDSWKTSRSLTTERGPPMQMKFKMSKERLTSAQRSGVSGLVRGQLSAQEWMSVASGWESCSQKWSGYRVNIN